jgi:hypothetical protein
MLRFESAASINFPNGDYIMALMHTEALSKAIASIGKRGASLNKDIQTAAVAAVGYSVLHGDVTFGNRLLDALGTWTRKDALVAFFEKYGNFAWMKQDKKLVFYKAIEGMTEKEFEEYAETLPQWDSAKRPPQIVSKYDVAAEFDKFLKRMEKLREDGTIELRNKALLDVLEDTTAKYHARLVLGTAADESQVA